ncbi:hypothetical protein [Sodalis sp. dw_96]|uniref:hypothetical protein n=1 Tax=Sodalis sp. dw_96 TaxID=2719794 RepID=UPI001BD58436|nr:hypothetical protein [Sodalis sp. dw_96]
MKNIRIFFRAIKKPVTDYSKRNLLFRFAFYLPAALIISKVNYSKASDDNKSVLSKTAKEVNTNTDIWQEPNSMNNLPLLLRQRDGLKLLGRCSNIDQLRLTEPSILGQKIDVVSYHPGWSQIDNGAIGGGEFWYDAADVKSIDNGGSVIVTEKGRRWKRITDQLLPEHFGCVPGAKNDVTVRMQNYVNESKNKTVIFSNGPWLISSTLDLSHVSKVVCSSSAIFIVDSTHFNGEWAITMGLPGKWNKNRADGLTLDGILTIHSLNRESSLNGIYIKGSWLNIGHLRTVNFNGIGIYQDSVWDSTVQRLSAELCGNITSPQIKLGSEGDTHNATHIISIQSEQAYHYALYINVVRDVIDNIHAERTYILSTNDGSELPSGRKYKNIYIVLGNSIINHSIFDASPLKKTPDNINVVTDELSVHINADYSSINTLNSSNGILSTTFGTLSEFNVFRCREWYFSEPATKNTICNAKINRLLAASDHIFENCEISEMLDFHYNAKNINFNFVDINTINLTAKYRGDHVFNNCNINKILNLSAPQDSYFAITFCNCKINSIQCGKKSRAIFNGGYIESVNLDDSAAIEFLNLSCNQFNYNGISEFTTSNLNVQNVIKWDVPHEFSYPLGKVTSKIGNLEQGGGVSYVKIDNKNKWKAISYVSH